MQIHNNVLTKKTIADCMGTIMYGSEQFGWNNSQTSWGEDINRGILGNISLLPVPEKLKKQIEMELGEILPEFENTIMQFFVWGPLSGISRHNDVKFKWGATIYLNENWDLDSGGIFLWEDRASGEVRAKVPEFNSIVLNDVREWHLVTPVSLCAIEDRMTIQIWGMGD